MRDNCSYTLLKLAWRLCCYVLTINFHHTADIKETCENNIKTSPKQTTWKGTYQSMNNTKYGRRKWKLLSKIEKITIGQAHVNTWKLNRNILTVMAVFLNQKRVNVCVLFWLRKTAVTVKIFQLSFRVSVLRWFLQFLVRVFTFLSLILGLYIYGEGRRLHNE